MELPLDLIDYFHAESNFPYNKICFFGSDGTIRGEYIKHNAIPMMEMIETANDPLPVIETEYGRIGFLICFDMDHHEYPRELSGIDILFDASNDWEALDPFHTYMSAINGIANGYAGRYG